ncbi:hypothetical protein ACFXGT_13795 [Streptomyces sp. NPDC059352]
MGEVRSGRRDGDHRRRRVVRGDRRHRRTGVETGELGHVRQEFARRVAG